MLLRRDRTNLRKLAICVLLVAITANGAGATGLQEDPGDSSSPSLYSRSSRRVDIGDLYERREIGFFSDEDEGARDGKEAEDLTRSKKALPPHPKSNRVSMLFKDPDRQIDEKLKDFVDIRRSSASDIIIRLQEKYEYGICEEMLAAAPRNEFFQYDTALVFPEGETPANRNDTYEKIKKTMPSRYRMHGEPCDYFGEFRFWSEMFVVSEKDHIKDLKEEHTGIGKNTKIEDLPEEFFDFTAISPKEIMERFNDVWVKYRDKGVCNQRLLLECLPSFDFVRQTSNLSDFSCQCRRNVVGLGTIFDVSKIIRVDDSYSIQYYQDNIEIVADKSVRNEKDPYINALKCSLVSGLPFIGVDLNIMNPCDFFLPMIGMCRAECVQNASCVSVPQDLKEKTERRSTKDLITRVKEQKIHAKYHNRCVCQKDKHCRNLEDTIYSDLGQRLDGLSPVRMVLLQLGVLSYSIRHTIL